MIFDLNNFYNFQQRLYGKNTDRELFLLNWVTRELTERLLFVDRTFEQTLYYPPLEDNNKNLLLQQAKIANLTCAYNKNIYLNLKNFTEFWLAAKLENDKYDLILAPFMLYPREDIVGFLSKIYNALKKDGLFLSVALGEGSLYELKHSLLQAEMQLTNGATPRVATFPSLVNMGSILSQVGFYLPVVDLETVTLSYSDIFALMSDLKAMGMQNILTNKLKKISHPKLFKLANEIYAKNFSNEQGKIIATFSLIFLSGWRVPDNPPELPKKGSANISLQQALRDITKKL
ncbi:methyltransferase [Bartonella sp. DGB1]|uniref:methyltransferase n=1 Tax=Bartonella sp. DGB1 TaxID=3239807 RepID=UPI0035243D06